MSRAENPYADPLPASVRRILSIPAEKRTKEQQRDVFGYYRTTIPEWTEANGKIDELMKTWPYGPTTLVLAPRHSLARLVSSDAAIGNVRQKRSRPARPPSSTRFPRMRRAIGWGWHGGSLIHTIR